MTEEERAKLVLEEKDPFLREIFRMGYDTISEDEKLRQISLIKHDGNYTKIINYSKFKGVFTVNVSFNRGKKHSWLCEIDGSAKRFRELIKPEK